MTAMFAYLLKRAWRNLRQSPFLCVATIATVAVALTVMAFFGVMVANLERMASHWSRDLQVVIYLERPPADATLRGWQAEIARLPAVEKVDYVSRDAAFAHFRQRLGPDADLLDGLSSDILPASLAISLVEEQRTRAGVAALATQLRRNPAFTDLRYGQDWLERFESFVMLLRVGALVLGGFLLFATVFVVANTIRLTLYARRDEVEVLTLVGATPLFIRIPYVIEGMLQGTVGGGLALLFCQFLYHVVLNRGLVGILPASGLERLVFLSPAEQLLLVGGGTLLGVVGSFAALVRLGRE